MDLWKSYNTDLILNQKRVHLMIPQCNKVFSVDIKTVGRTSLIGMWEMRIRNIDNTLSNEDYRLTVISGKTENILMKYLRLL